jgi:hypothetical protein
MKIEAATAEEYLEQVGPRGEQLRDIDALIRKYAPDLKPSVSGGIYGNMLAYGMQPYQTKAMKAPSEWPLLMLGAQKNHLSLYACAVIDGQYIAERYADKLGKVSCGKSCIRFTSVEDLQRSGLIAMLEDLNRRFVAGEKLYGM